MKLKLNQIKKLIARKSEVKKIIYDNKILYLKDSSERHLEVAPKNLVLDTDIKFADIKANESLFYMVQNDLNWVQVDVGIASGNREVAHALVNKNYTGRLDKVGTINIIEVEQDQEFSSLSTSYNVIQKGKPEFISINTETTPESTFNINKEGGIKTIDLISNSKLINKNLIDGDDCIVIHNEYSINYSTSVEFGEDIPNDIGANEEYIFTVTIMFSENITENDKIYKVQFLTENGNKLELTFTQFGN